MGAPQPERKPAEVTNVLAGVVVVELGAAADGLSRGREGARGTESPEGVDGGQGGDDARGVSSPGEGRGGGETRYDAGDGLDEILDGVGAGEVGGDGDEGNVAEGGDGNGGAGGVDAVVRERSVNAQVKGERVRKNWGQVVTYMPLKMPSLP